MTGSADGDDPVGSIGEGDPAASAAGNDRTGPAPGRAETAGSVPEGDAATEAGGREPAGSAGALGEQDSVVRGQGDVVDTARETGHAAAGAPPGSSARSGLRDPVAAARGLGAGTLVLEAVVLMLAIQPIRIMGGQLGGWGVGVVLTLAVVAVGLAGMMRHAWAWKAGAGLQLLLVGGGVVHWSLAVLGLIFAAVWAYASHVRRAILG